MKNDMTSKNKAKVHVYEIDLIRSITVFSVVALHSLAFTKIYLTDKMSLIPYTLLGHILHYNREMFMFVTAFVLTFVYQNRQYSIKTFWLKRLLVVFIPYVLWSFIYVKFNRPEYDTARYLEHSIYTVLTGEASFQLYYILLTLQFYAIFPFFLAFIKKVRSYAWTVLSISLFAQLGYLFYDFHYLQLGIHDVPTQLSDLFKYRDRIFITYQFFFFMGGFAALYMEQSRQFLFKISRYIIPGFLISLFIYAVYFFIEIGIFNWSLGRAATVLQPSVTLYSTATIIFYVWIAMHWALQRPLYRLIHVISAASFGIFFVHVMILSLLTNYILPVISPILPVFLLIPMVIIITFGTSVFVSYVLLRSKYLSWTIGKAQKFGWPQRKTN